MTPTVKIAFEYYLATAQITPSTRKQMLGSQEKCLRAGLLDVEIARVTPKIVRQYVNALARELQPATVHRNARQLMQVVNRYITDHALQLPHIDLRNIVKHPRRKDDEQRLDESFSLEQIQEIVKMTFTEETTNLRKLQVNEVQAKVRDLWVLMCMTGMALADLLTYNGQIENKQWVIYRRVKTSQLATAPLFPISHEIIAKYDWPLRGISRRTIQFYCVELGRIINRRLTAHTARYSCGRLLLDLGLSMEAVSKVLGHANPLITSQIYAKTSKEKIAAELEAISPVAMEKINNLTLK